MSVYSCLCLNICAEMSAVTPSSSSAVAHLESALRSKSVGVGALKSRSIQFESLTAVTAVSVPPPTVSSASIDYIVFRCTNCHVDVVAVSSSSSAESADAVVFAETRLHSSHTAIDRLKETSPNYSAAFDVLIDASADRPTSRRPSLSQAFLSAAATTATATTPAESLRAALERRLESEQTAMAIRISAFTAQQNDEYHAFEVRARHELQALTVAVAADAAYKSGVGAIRSSSPLTASPLSSRRSLSASPSVEYESISAFIKRTSLSPNVQRHVISGIRHRASDADFLVDDAVEAVAVGGTNSPNALISRTPVQSTRALSLSSSIPRGSLDMRSVAIASGRISPRMMSRERAGVSTNASASIERIDWAPTPTPTPTADQSDQVRVHSHRRKAPSHTSGIFELDDNDAAASATAAAVDTDTTQAGASADDEAADDDESSSDEEEEKADDSDGALSDEDVVAEVALSADIHDMIRRSSVPAAIAIVSNSTAAPASSTIPSSLPIPIPAPLRALLAFQDRADLASDDGAEVSDAKSKTANIDSLVDWKKLPPHTWRRDSYLHVHSARPDKAQYVVDDPILNRNTTRPRMPTPPLPMPMLRAAANAEHNNRAISLLSSSLPVVRGPLGQAARQATVRRAPT